jgi:hypothetical protein
MIGIPSCTYITVEESLRRCLPLPGEIANDFLECDEQMRLDLKRMMLMQIDKEQQMPGAPKLGYLLSSRERVYKLQHIRYELHLKYMHLSRLPVFT